MGSLKILKRIYKSCKAANLSTNEKESFWFTWCCPLLYGNLISLKIHENLIWYAINKLRSLQFPSPFDLFNSWQFVKEIWMVMPFQVICILRKQKTVLPLNSFWFKKYWCSSWQIIKLAYLGFFNCCIEAVTHGTNVHFWVSLKISLPKKFFHYKINPVPIKFQGFCWVW